MSNGFRGRVVSVVGAVAAIGAGAAAVGVAQGSSNDGTTLRADLSSPRHADLAHPGEAVTVTGKVLEVPTSDPTADGQGVPATFSLQTVDADGQVLGTFGPFEAGPDGKVTATVPGSATDGVHPDASTDYSQVLALQLVGASYGSASTADGAPAGEFAVGAAPTSGVVLQNSFVSSVGWVKPGETYPFVLKVLNYDMTPALGATATLTAPDATTLIDPDGAGGVDVTGNTLTWNAGTVPAATLPPGGKLVPGEVDLAAQATADTYGQDPQIAWKDLSTDATLTTTVPGGSVASRSHGPKVIPASGGFETARYGDRPFPVVPVDFVDRQHDDTTAPASLLDSKINDPANPGSTFNLYQEMSYGQLFPEGTVPSDGVATADWASYTPGFDFSKTTLLSNPQTCHGITEADLPGNAYTANPRIVNGWYELPGTTDYYGDDSFGSALIGAEAGVGALQNIDSACGPTGKAVYDAAQIADPEIDYSDYDTDKDGVVDFFMMIFPGAGGNGDSQTSVPPYDNIWPHSADLRGAYTDPTTGLTGYISDDQLKDNQDRPLWYTDDSRTQMTTQDTGDALKVFVRVGPYNVNPETAVTHASVISHEYGHSLGLPDYYSTGSRTTYGTWTLMAEDHSQNMDIIGKKELGWVVPRVLQPSTHVDATNWEDTKKNTHRIDWETPDGTPYTLQGNDVNNGQGYEAALPGRQIISAADVPSGSHLYFSGSGNDFGCTPDGGHNLDIALPQLAQVPAGTPITLTFKSRFDIEWDFDYGFVMTTTDNGKSYTSLPSDNGYTTPATQNPNQAACQAKYGNGITGSGASFDAGTAPLDRVLGNYGDPTFVNDSYDLSADAGKATTLRFSYATDPGLARPGWFIDDVKVTAGDQVIYQSDFENANDTAIVNGGCAEGGLRTAPSCTDGWQYVTGGQGSSAEHGYLLEMRDRSGFDDTGHGEDDRGTGPTFSPGVLLTYTDENHGYGNAGTDDPPAQSPLDSQPETGSETPNLDDAAFTAAAGDSQYTDSGAGHIDNYADPSTDDGLWHFDFKCLTFNVSRLAGDDAGPEAQGTYNLNGDASFDMGAGCAQFNFGGSNAAGPGGSNAKSDGRRQAKPEKIQAAKPSASTAADPSTTSTRRRTSSTPGTSTTAARARAGRRPMSTPRSGPTRRS